MPRQVRGGHSRQEEAPTKKLVNTTIAARQQPDAQARLIALIEKELDGPVRCGACQRPLHAFRSVLACIGPVCLRKRSGGRS
jgi:hypothetical protein